VQLTVVCCGESCKLPRFLDLRGLLAFWLLWELRLGPLLGAQLSERLGWRRGETPSPGTIYPALANLERDGLVKKTKRGRDTSYDLTPRGTNELACAAAYLRVVLRDVMAPTA
jgi:DNA-binding PadR family transcriptional regulator